MSTVNAILSMGALGLLFGALLGVADKVFSVEKDPRIDQIIDVLPGANCGACGYPGCRAWQAIASGAAPVDGCPVARSAWPTSSPTSWGACESDCEPSVCAGAVPR